eukprot:scaffold42695_cov61-Attheya_sp.AAC.1
MLLQQEYYYAQWLRNMEDTSTAEVFREVITSPVIAQDWRCDNGAPVNVEGYPLTQYYAQDNECVLVGPAPAFFPINQETPTDLVPSKIILQRWPTGPGRRIVESNPLYQYARSNVPIQDEELWAKPTIHAFNRRFFNTYDLLPNMMVTAFRNMPHNKTDYFKQGADYHLEPPNINGQFPALHHNFYVKTYLVNVYNNEQRLPLHILDVFDPVYYQQWRDMSDIDLMHHVGRAFLNCRDDEKRTALWTTMVPSLQREETAKTVEADVRDSNIVVVTSAVGWGGGNNKVRLPG